MLESVNMVCPGCVWISCACYNEGKKRGVLKEMARSFVCSHRERLAWFFSRYIAREERVIGRKVVFTDSFARFFREKVL